MRFSCTLALVCLLPACAFAQTAVSVRVRVLAEGAPVRSAMVSSQGLQAQTDSSGLALLRLGPGRHEISVTRQGYVDARSSVIVTASDTRVTVELDPSAQELEPNRGNVDTNREAHRGTADSGGSPRR